jgi:hypothetical protein
MIAAEKTDSQVFKVCYRKKSDNEDGSVISIAHISVRDVQGLHQLTSHYTTGLPHLISYNTKIIVSGGENAGANFHKGYLTLHNYSTSYGRINDERHYGKCKLKLVFLTVTQLAGRFVLVQASHLCEHAMQHQLSHDKPSTQN